jgi:hypothetical protein
MTLNIFAKDRPRVCRKDKSPTSCIEAKTPLPRADKVLVIRTPKPRPQRSPKPRVAKTVQPKMTKKVKPPTPPIADPPKDGVPLIKLRHHHCRNVVGRGKDGLATYCGKPRKWQSSFCVAHHALFYVPASERRYHRG